jgi:small-conductance mechanosensitive channel
MTAPTAAKTALQHPSIRNRIVVAGQLLPEFSQFALTESNVNEIWSTLADMVYLNDIILLLIVSFSAIPIARLIHRIWMATPQTGDDTKEGNKGDTSTEDRFAGSYTFTIAQIISHIAKITIIVYVIDCVLVVLYVAGVKFVVSDRDLSVKAAKILYSTYVALRLIQFKRYLIGHAVNRDPDKLEKVILVDKVMDTIVFAYLALHILNTLTIEVTFLSSLFAFGGMGTLIFSLASKDLAVLVVSGLALNVTEKFRKGDQIRLGDSTQGTVEKMGWLYTELRLGDDVIVKLPNSQLSGQRMVRIHND